MEMMAIMGNYSVIKTLENTGYLKERQRIRFDWRECYKSRIGSYMFCESWMGSGHFILQYGETSTKSGGGTAPSLKIKLCEKIMTKFQKYFGNYNTMDDLGYLDGQQQLFLFTYYPGMTGPNSWLYDKDKRPCTFGISLDKLSKR